MAERIYIDADDSPLTSDIKLLPVQLGYDSNRLLNIQILYELMASYLFKDVQVSHTPTMKNAIDRLPSTLNSNNYKNLEITESTIDLADESLPRYADADFKEYLEHFLDEIERQNLVTLSEALYSRKILTTSKSLDNFLGGGTRTKMNAIGFTIGDLLNKSRMNLITGYIEEEGNVEITDFDYTYADEDREDTEEDKKELDTSDLMQAVDSSKPIWNNYIDDFIDEETTGVISVDTTSYINKVTNLSGLGTFIKTKEGRRFKFRAAVKKGQDKNINYTKDVGKLQYLRVYDDSLESNGLLGDKTFTGDGHIEQAYDYITALEDRNTSLIIDFFSLRSNKIKDIILDKVRPEDGKLITGQLEIKYRYEQTNLKDFDTFNTKIKNMRDPEYESKKYSDADAKEFQEEYDDFIALWTSFRAKGKGATKNRKKVIQRLTKKRGKQWLKDSVDLTVAEYYKKLEQDYEDIPEHLIPKESSFDRETLDSRITPKILEARGGFAADSYKDVSMEIPLLYITTVTFKHNYILEFKPNRTYIGGKVKGIQQLKDKATSHRDVKYAEAIPLNDISDLNRIKASYLSLVRMVERYG